MNTEMSQDAGFVVSGRNYGLVPMQGQATDAETQLARLEDFMNAGYDAEAAKRAREYYGEGVPIEHISEEDKSFFAGAAFARIKGVPNNPEAYWHAQKKDIPDADREQLFELLGADLRQQVRGRWDERQARIKAVEESLGRMDVYVRGDEFGEAFSEQDLANVRGVMDAETMADAEAVRAWMRTYMLPLAGKDDAEEVLRTVDGLEDEFFEVIGTSPRRAEMAYNAMLHWAEGMKQSGKVGVADEFIVAVGKKISNWGKVAHLMAPAVAMAPVGNPDFPIMLSDEAMAGQQAELARRHEEYARHENARSILRAAINKSLELGDHVSWWKGAARTASQMAGDSSAYLLPGVGMYTGTADLLIGGATETVDRFALQGLSGDAAAGQAAIETGVQALVELTPWGRVGGKGLSAFTRRYFGEAIEKGTAGKLSRWVVRNTQNSTMRALVAEGAVSFVDEGILEPIAGGLMTYGAEQAADVLGIPHGQSREFAACFDELTALYTDPYQAAGLFLFTAGLTGAGAYGVRENVRYFAKHRKMWEAAGLTPEQVDRVMAADDRVELGGKLVREGWESDPAGMRERVLKANKDFAERGEVLVLTGEGALDAELENSELAPAYRAVWQEYQDKGLLPKVEAVGNNQFRITKEGVDITLDARGADAYLQHAIDEVDSIQTRELQQRLGKEHFVDLRAELADAVSAIAGNAAMRAAEAAGERTGVAVTDITKGLPEWLADGIVKRGQITLKDAQDITEWAIGRIDGLVQEGMSPADARLTRASADGMARTLGDWSTFARDFAHREQLAGLQAGTGAISISRTRNEQAVTFDGRQVLGQTIMTLPGNVRHQGAVEDVTESFADMMVQQRAQAIREANPDSSPAEAENAAWQELGEVVQRARAAMIKADAEAEIEEVKPGDRMSIIEALSTMATSRFVASGAVPGWMQGLTAALKGNLAAADALAKVRAAYASVLQNDPSAVSGLDAMLDKLGVYVQDTFREARVEAVDIQAWKNAHALVAARADSPAGSGGAPVSAVVQEAERTEEEIVRNERQEEPEADLQTTPTQEVEEAREVLQQMAPAGNAPADMKGVFVDDQCYYNQAGGFWCGMIDKHKLHDGTEQVKVGAKGKHGVIAGRELTGKFQQNVGAIYVWKRTDGELQVISGRHRFAKLMEDDSAQSCNAYVFEEDAEHDERWARMLDYENNMRDDQADEVTAATYVRETGLSDTELEVRGLMRNGTRCKRGALIGRFAREELWTRFINGAVKPLDAEVICHLTRSIRDQGRVEEIQRRCCMLLEEKKSWEYIGAMVQLMANKEMVTMKQGLLDFGADFEADLARAAEWIERNIKAINESVTLLKQGRKLSGKKRAEAERLGITTATQEGTEQMLYDLEMLKGQFELIGSYPDLVAQAQMWDGKTEVDPVGQYLERARAEREQVRAEGDMDVEEYLESRLDDATGEFSFSIFNERRWANDVWPTRAMKKIEADWLERLDAYIAEYQAAKANPNMKRPMGQEIYVCPTPGVLSLVGVTSRDVVTTRHALDHDMFTKHGMTRKALRHLPSAIANPICIAESQSVPGALEILTTLTETVEDSKTKALVKKNVLVALHVGVTSSTDRKLIVSKIASAYGKNRIRTIINKHKILYWNDQKGKVMLNDYRLQLPQAVAHDLSTGNIWDFNDLVKYKQQNQFSFSMERASLRALDVLRFRSDERAGETLIKDWQAACENWGRFGREDAGRLGNGAKMLGEIQALIGATKGVLPERYCRMGHLNGLMRWAAIYARMQQDGTLPQVGEIKGPIYQKFLDKLQQADELNRLQGMSEQEAKEAMALLAGERLDTAMLKVARECRRRLELFLKDRELERIEHIVEKAYPKRQNGQKWPRGKMAADAYRRMERAREYMNLPADEVAERINDAKRKLDALDATDTDFERKEEELEEEISLLQTFGCWENMGFEQARRACGVMSEMVLLGRAKWKEKLQAERRRANYDRAQISRNFRTKLADVQRTRAKTDAKEKARKRTIGKKLAMGTMSYSQLMLALEPQLGKEFTGRHMRMIAKAHERLQTGTQQLHRRMYSTLSEITGLKTEGEMEEWLKSNNEIIDTGIVLKPMITETCRMTPEEVEEWLALSKAQRDARRKQAEEEAAATGELPDNVPSEAALQRMREKLAASRKADTTAKEYVVTIEKRYESPLHCTKEAMLFAILTFEQEDYTRLMDVNGVNEKALQRMRELVGDKLLRWGYAMREMLNEQGLTMAAIYEAHTGVPFAKRANYFRGVFDIAKVKDKGESIDSATSITGGKYGCLIPRQYHHQMLNWGTSATQVFIGTYKEQQNYICTSHITREWRTLLSNQGFEKRLRAEIGDAALDMIHGWCKLIDGSVIADAKVNAMMNRMLGRVMGAYAVSRLAGNVYTIIKQVSAVLNGFAGGYVPEQVLAGDAVAQQLTYRHIGFGEYASALARAMSGQTEISAKEIANAGFIAGRKRVQGAHLEEAAMLAPGQSVPGKVGRAGRAVYEANMDAIGYVDLKCNALAALAVADAVYRAAKRENKDGLVPDAELRRIAIETAGMAIDRAAQPQLRTQKGYWAAGGGAFGAMGNFFYMFKSEVLGKLGLYVGQMFAGHHGAWIGGALSFGVLNSLVLALIDYVRGYWYDDEQDKWEKRAKQFAWNVFANDISAVPVLGDLEGWGRSTLLGGRPWNSSLVDMVVPFKDMYTYGKREVRNVAEEESWDKHVQALCGFARALGAAGGWWQGNSRVAVGSCAELALAAAAISNIVRFGKDVVRKVQGEEE